MMRTGPEWRNGRRDGLKIRCPQGRVGSNPTSGTTFDVRTHITVVDIGDRRATSSPGKTERMEFAVVRTDVDHVVRHRRRREDGAARCGAPHGCARFRRAGTPHSPGAVERVQLEIVRADVDHPVRDRR